MTQLHHGIPPLSMLAPVLTDPELAFRAPATCQQGWLDAKELRGAPITAGRLARLEAMTSHYPAPPAVTASEDDLAAALERARPAITAACERVKGERAARRARLIQRLLGQPEGAA
ncbi:hypothetical protein PVT71_14675 [Salipiger sp. H15]|uniref:Uncharacterized protein n=1 Tax=Alloyangia sp. H15 TaxID=3029062 RepID=A0AAU8AN79_9RHOB